MSDPRQGEPPWLFWKDCTSFNLLEHFGIRTAPIDIDKIATDLGIHVHYVPDPGWEGAVVSSTSRADIWVRAESPRHRRRFTLAHELGHLLLHPVGIEFRDAAPGMQNHPPTEIQANAFAGALLMPRFLLQPLIYESNDSLVQMAQRFDVAPTAVSLRLEWVMRGKEDL